MDRPGSRVEFQTKDYPDGLSVYVDGRMVYGGAPPNRSQQPSWADLGYVSQDARSMDERLVTDVLRGQGE